MTTRKKTPPKEEVSQPFSKKEFINAIIKKKQRNKWLKQ